MVGAIAYFIKTTVSQTHHFLTITFWEKRENLKFLFIMLLIFFGFGKRKTKVVNTFYNLWDLLAFGKQLKDAIFFHNKMARHTLDPKHKGIKAWEYGLLLSNAGLKKGTRVLDVASGSSAMPFYLAKKGLNVTAFDLEIPQEKPSQGLLKRFTNVSYQQGSMLKLPFEDNSFDLVLNISAIEHLNNNKPLPKHAKKALTEMIRVLKPNGRLFLTSDIYYSKLQKTDRYSQNFGYKGIRAAFSIDNFDMIFLRSLDRLNCDLIGLKDFNFEAVLNDINRSNYRGRFITTFAIYAQKKA